MKTLITILSIWSVISILFTPLIIELFNSGACGLWTFEDNSKKQKAVIAFLFGPIVWSICIFYFGIIKPIKLFWKFIG